MAPIKPRLSDVVSVLEQLQNPESTNPGANYESLSSFVESYFSEGDILRKDEKIRRTVFYDFKDELGDIFERETIDVYKLCGADHRHIKPWIEQTQWQKVCCCKIAPIGADRDASLKSMVTFGLLNDSQLNEESDGKYNVEFIMDSAGKYKLINKTLELELHGDTMNSHATVIHNIVNKSFEKLNVKNSQNYFLPPYCFFKQSNEAAILDNYKYFETILPNYGLTYLSLVYTIGNFIPVASSFNNRGNKNGFSKDFWDLALACVYNYYPQKNGASEELINNKQYCLENLLLANKNSFNLCKNWLDSFKDERGNPSWDVFIEKNYLQDWVVNIIDKNDKVVGYGAPKELWDGHFNGPVMPENGQFSEFFKTASIRILARGARIANEVQEILKGKTPAKLEELAKKISGYENEK